jgi:hypothetical protein
MLSRALRWPIECARSLPIDTQHFPSDHEGGAVPVNVSARETLAGPVSVSGLFQSPPRGRAITHHSHRVLLVQRRKDSPHVGLRPACAWPEGPCRLSGPRRFAGIGGLSRWLSAIGFAMTVAGLL